MARKFITRSQSGEPTPRPALSTNKLVATLQSTTHSRRHKSKVLAQSTIITRPRCTTVFSLMPSMWTSRIIWWCQILIWVVMIPEKTCSTYRTCTHRVNHLCLSSRCRMRSVSSGRIILIIRVRWPTNSPHLGPFTTQPRSAAKDEHTERWVNQRSNELPLLNFNNLSFNLLTKITNY